MVMGCHGNKVIRVESNLPDQVDGETLSSLYMEAFDWLVFAS